MRTVSFLDPDVRARVSDQFECAWTNIDPKLLYRPGLYKERGRLNLPNATGANNIALLFATPDRKVLHVLPGYWDPKTILEEIDFVLKLRDAVLDEHYRFKAGAPEAFDRMHLDRAKSLRDASGLLETVHRNLRWDSIKRLDEWTRDDAAALIADR
ncbi:MAG TPA: hypothetical protein VI643_08095 [Planctomycetota bacterium]|nr:hypothetical protein [Planctomycetota bacterium]